MAGHGSNGNLKYRDREHHCPRVLSGSTKYSILEFHIQGSWVHALWPPQIDNTQAFLTRPLPLADTPTVAHQAAASPSSPAICQLSPGAGTVAETASLRSGGKVRRPDLGPNGAFPLKYSNDL